MKAKTARRSKRKASAAGDLVARHSGAGADKPGEAQGVIAIIGPEGGTR